MTGIFRLVALIAIAGPAIADDTALPPELLAIIGQRTADCSSFEDGELSQGNGTIQRVDLNGDGTMDWVLDEFFLNCSSAASLFCGTGGCGVHFQIGDVVTSRLAKGWEFHSMPPLSLLLLQVHGSNCGGTNLNPCVEALAWDSDELRYFSLTK